MPTNQEYWIFYLDLWVVDKGIKVGKGASKIARDSI